MRVVILASGKSGLRKLKPRYLLTSASRAILPFSTSCMTPTAATILEIEAIRYLVSLVAGRSLAGTALST